MRQAPFTSSFHLIGEHRVHMRSSIVDNGTPIVFIHGLSVSGVYMLPLAQCFTEEYSLYIPDLPGFGKSNQPAHVLNISEMADVLAAWMDTITLSSAIFICNSLGCQIVIDLASRYPGRVTHAVLLGPTMDPSSPTLLGQMVRLLKDGFHEPLSYMPLGIGEYLHSGIRRTFRTATHALGDPVLQKISLLSIPICIVRGEKDPIVSHAWVEQLHTAAQHSRLESIRGAGHVLNYNSPDAVARIVSSFLKNPSE